MSHPLYSFTLFYQVSQAPGGVGAPGPEKDPVSQAVVLVTTRRLQTIPALVTLKTVNPGAPGDPVQPSLPHHAHRSGPKCVRRPAGKVSQVCDSHFYLSPLRCLESLEQLEFLQSFLWRRQVQVPTVYQGRLSIG